MLLKKKNIIFILEHTYTEAFRLSGSILVVHFLYMHNLTEIDYNKEWHLIEMTIHRKMKITDVLKLSAILDSFGQLGFTLT